MSTPDRITAIAWSRRHTTPAARRPRCKREWRSHGFVGPRAADLRRSMKQRAHRHARRTVRMTLRWFIAPERLSNER